MILANNELESLDNNNNNNKLEWLEGLSGVRALRRLTCGRGGAPIRIQRERRRDGTRCIARATEHSKRACGHVSKGQSANDSQSGRTPHAWVGMMRSTPVYVRAREV